MVTITDETGLGWIYSILYCQSPETLLEPLDRPVLRESGRSDS